MADVIPASIDFSAIPPEYEGKWILVKVDPIRRVQEIVSSGDSLREATRGHVPGDEVVLTRVPHRASVIFVGDRSE